MAAISLPEAISRHASSLRISSISSNAQRFTASRTSTSPFRRLWLALSIICRALASRRAKAAASAPPPMPAYSS